MQASFVRLRRRRLRHILDDGHGICKWASASRKVFQMGITIQGHSFEGPFTDTSHLQDKPGVYSILDKRRGAKWSVIDVGESEAVKNRVENHDRKDCWEHNRQGTLGVAVLYTPGWSAAQRRALESKIREAFAPVCGVR